MMDLNYKSFGTGDPVIILHGLFGMLDNWKTFARKLSEDRQVFIIDLPNHGRSPALYPFNYGIMAEAVREFMESQWLFTADVIGHSMGGKVAMKLALEHPDLVNSLTVVDIAPVQYKGGHEHIISAMESLTPKELENRNEAKDKLMKDLRDEMVVNFLMKNLTRSKEGNYQWKFELQNLKKAYPDILMEIRSEHIYDGPTLIVRGEKSKYILDEQTVEIEKLFPEYRLETISGAGHWVHADKPEELLDLIREFLR